MPRLHVVLALLCVATSVAAQVRPRYGPRPPAAYTTLSAGLWQSAAVDDGTTGSTWDFGNATQFRVALDRPLDGQSSIGVAATFARVPLTYRATSATCAACDADANVTQLFATYHLGGSSLGFHQVVDIDLGATLYSNFRARQGNVRLAPSSDADFAFSLGYGFGYALSPTTQIELVQQFGGSVHQRTNLAGSADAVTRSNVTRLGVRLALGER